MRPPEFTGGNLSHWSCSTTRTPCFNEAAGIHRRKLAEGVRVVEQEAFASMRPPEFTGGNLVRRQEEHARRYSLQ